MFLTINRTLQSVGLYWGFGIFIKKIKMKLRNPMKNKWGQWKDDATLTEKFFWSFIFVSTGMALGSLIASFF